MLLLSQHPLALIAGLIDVLDNRDGTYRVSAKVFIIHKAMAELLLCLCLLCCLFLLLKLLRFICECSIKCTEGECSGMTEKIMLMHHFSTNAVMHIIRELISVLFRLCHSSLPHVDNFTAFLGFM